MKKRIPLLAIVLIPSMLLFAGCSDTTKTLDVSANEAPGNTISDDHHDGENVEPHGHDEDIDDHHDGEEDVEPHGHDEEDGHDDTGLPPHRH